MILVAKNWVYLPLQWACYAVGVLVVPLQDVGDKFAKPKPVDRRDYLDRALRYSGISRFNACTFQ